MIGLPLLDSRQHLELQHLELHVHRRVHGETIREQRAGCSARCARTAQAHAKGHFAVGANGLDRASLSASRVVAASTASSSGSGGSGRGVVGSDSHSHAHSTTIAARSASSREPLLELRDCRS